MGDNAWSRQLVAATFDDERWAEVLEDHDPVFLATELKRVIRDIGQQEQLRLQGLAQTRTDPEVNDDEYEATRRNLAAWKRSVARVRASIGKRLADVQPRAQDIIDAHQADRRSLVILAKRLWLWEEGADEDGLDTALDDCSISDSINDPSAGRKTLRELVLEMLDRNGVIEP